MTGSIIGLPFSTRSSMISGSLSGYTAGSPAGQAQQTSPGGPNLSSAYTGPFAATSILGQPFSIFLGMVLLMFLLKFLSEHDRTDIDPAHLHIGGYNLLAVGVTSVVFIVMLKVIFNRWQIPGLTQLANFV